MRGCLFGWLCPAVYSVGRKRTRVLLVRSVRLLELENNRSTTDRCLFFPCILCLLIFSPHVRVCVQICISISWRCHFIETSPNNIFSATTQSVVYCFYSIIIKLSIWSVSIFIARKIR